MMAGSIVPRDRYQLLRREGRDIVYRDRPSAQYIVDTIQYKLNKEFEANVPCGRLLAAMRQYAADQCNIDLHTTVDMPPYALFAALATVAGLPRATMLVMAWDTEAQRRWPLVVCWALGICVEFECEGVLCYYDDDDLDQCTECYGRYCSKCRRDFDHRSGRCFDSRRALMTDGPPDLDWAEHVTCANQDLCLRLNIMSDVSTYLIGIDEPGYWNRMNFLKSWFFWAWKTFSSKVNTYPCRASFDGDGACRASFDGDGATYCIWSCISGIEIVQLRFVKVSGASSYDPQRRLLEDVRSVLASVRDPNHGCAIRYLFNEDDDVYKHICAIAGRKELVCRPIQVSSGITQKKKVHRLVNKSVLRP